MLLLWPFPLERCQIQKNARQQSCRVFHQLSESVLLASVQPPQLKVHWIGDSCRPAVCAMFAAPGTGGVSVRSAGAAPAHTV